MATVAMRLRAPPLRLRRPRAPHRASPIRSRHRSPQSSPNPSRLGGFNPLSTHLQAGGEGEGGDEEENGGALWSARRSRTCGSRARLRPPASSTSSSPRRLSASPTSAAAFLVTASRTSSPTPSPPGPIGPVVSTAFHFPLWHLAFEPWTGGGHVRRDRTEHFRTAVLAAV
jgi:hypothetical protein